MHTTYQKKQYEIRVFFAHALFVPKNPNVMGFSGSVNGTTKNPGFLDFGFCQCKWALLGNLREVFRSVGSFFYIFFVCVLLVFKEQIIT